MNVQTFSIAKHPPERGSSAFGYPLLMGFNAQVIQLVLFRETLILSNGSEISLGACLAVWALFNGLGALTSWGSSRMRIEVGRFFSPMLAGMPVVLGISIFAARLVRGLVEQAGSEPIPLLSFSLLAVIVLAPVTFLDGFMFLSVLKKVFGKGGGGRNTSTVYGVASFGALAGGMLFSLVFVVLIDPFVTAGLLLFMNSAFFLLQGRRRKAEAHARGRAGAILSASLCVAGIAVMVAGPGLNMWSERIRWKVLQPSLAWEASTETPYQNLAVLRYEEEYSIFANGHLMYTLRAVPSLQSGDWERAVFPNFAMLQHEAPKNILLVGGGPRGFVNDIIEHVPADLKWVEFDRGLLDMCERFMIEEERKAWDHSAVQRIETDGRLFVKSVAPGSQDVIIVDVPDPSNANVNRFYTQEFFEECRTALADDGVLVLGLTCQPNYIGHEMLQRNGAVFSALKKTFPHVRVTPGTFSFFVAGNEEAAPTADAETLVSRYQLRGVQSKRFSPYVFHTTLEPDDVAWIDELFNTALAEGRFSINTDDRPVAYYVDALLAARLTSDTEERASGAPGGDPLVEGVGLSVDFLLPVAVILPSLGAILCLITFLRRGRGSAKKAGQGLFLLTALAIGFCGIVFEVAVLFAFQNQAGYLYSRLGVLIACYMAGLAAGSLGGAKRLSDRSPFALSMLLALLGWGGTAALVSGSGFMVLGPLPLLILFGVANALFGASGGFAFRGVALALDELGTRGGGLIYALDLLGTFAGGWLAGSRIIPFLGIAHTLFFACAVFVSLCLFAFFSDHPANRSKYK